MTHSNAKTDLAMWQRVREAITKRWPDIDRDALSAVDDNSGDLVQFVKTQVDAEEDEIRSVVGEFAPDDPLVNRVAHAAGDRMHDAAESAQFARMRADEYIATRPTESVLTSFVSGILVGAVVTALLMRSAPQPTMWDRMTPRRWN